MDDEFGVAEDLEDLLATPRSAAKKVPGRTRTETAATPEPGVTLDQLRGLLGEMKDTLKAELRAELAPPRPAPVVNVTVPEEVAPRSSLPPEYKIPTEPEEGTTETGGIKIHFVEDGFTVGVRVFYRGEEFVAPAGTEWAKLTTTQQYARFGKKYFQQGMWEGQGFDLDDPTLTEDDRVKLLEIMRKRESLEV